jgi:uncharacterized membrane protein (UPF0127 family)
MMLLTNSRVLAHEFSTSPLMLIRLRIGGHLVRAEVANTEETRARGLMFRQHLETDRGMLFIFNETAGHCFWMRHTKIPLSIAFIDDYGIITDIKEMQPESMRHYCPTQAGRYALEMNNGWFSRKGIQPGALVNGLPH